ncbi:hypothetical protein F2Q68_00018309 [Brassica cretica]|uniref:Response regulatory domain-containing protein n=1 Tax=Brassica cretica TaxID=69181 RepID=A0A8S9HA34_BRACR|nr:hypothetical protein F2Q68_00018309 [Brassica cretica]
MLAGNAPGLQHPNSNSILRGLIITLAYDDVNRTVTKRLLEKLGCEVTAVSSGFECLSALSNVEMPYRFKQYLYVIALLLLELEFDVLLRRLTYAYHGECEAGN